MASKKKKDVKTEDKSSILPKTIAGVKIPKGIRNKLSDLARHPVVSDLISAGLVAVAARLKGDDKSKNEATAAPAPTEAASAPAQPPAETPIAAPKPAAKRARKPAAPKPAAEIEAPAAAAKPVARRTRKPSAAAPAPARAKSIGESVAPKPPVRRTRKPSGESSTAKPRAARRPAPSAPKKPPAPDAGE